jgi:hypothetical protein
MISSFARGSLRIFGCLCSIYVFIIFGINDAISFLWAIPLVGFGLAALFITSTKGIKLYAPLIFILYYFFGVLLSFADFYMNSNSRIFANHASLGSFTFTDADMAPMVIASCVGLLSFVAAKLFYERILISSKPRNVKATEEMDKQKTKRYVIRWAIIWFILSCLVIFLMSYLEIGQIGLKTKVELPLKLAGVLVFIKLILIPAFGCLLLNLSFISKNRGAINIILILIVVIALFGALATISRSYIMNCLLPVVIYLLFFSYRNSPQKKLFVLVSAISIPVLVIGVQAIELLRLEGFKSGYLSPSTAVETLGDWQAVDINGVLSLSKSLTTEAISGARELMAATSSQISDLYAPIAIFKGDDDYTRNLMLSVFHFVPLVDDTRAAGMGFGLWGGFMLGGSYVFLFIGSFCACMIVCWVERIFLKRNLYLVALFFSIYFSLRVWRSFYFFILSRELLITLAFYFLMKLILTKIQRSHKVLNYGDANYMIDTSFL